MLQIITEQLTKSTSLRAEEVRTAVDGLTSEAVPAEDKAAFLTALASKGESIEEIAAFAQTLRERSVEVPLSAELRRAEILDVCGTGGDHLRTFNISTTVALVVAAAGVAVAKHGNRAVTSQSGSADVLEALGIPIDLSPEQAAASLATHGFAFFFAPRYHPAFRHIAPARKMCAERGQRTIFNFLGPLLNPARPTAQLLGVPRADLCDTLARVLQRLGLRRASVVSGQVPTSPTEPAIAGLDEVSTLGETRAAEFDATGEVLSRTYRPEDFGIPRARLSDLTGGDRSVNAEITRAILSGRERGARRDAVLLNAAIALVVARKVASVPAGLALAAEVIDGGRAQAKLDALRAPVSA